MIKVYCDVCKNEMKGKEKNHNILLKNPKTEKNKSQYPEKGDIHVDVICDKCYIKLFEFTKRFLKGIMK